MWIFEKKHFAMKPDQKGENKSTPIIQERRKQYVLGSEDEENEEGQNDVTEEEQENREGEQEKENEENNQERLEAENEGEEDHAHSNLRRSSRTRKVKEYACCRGNNAEVQTISRDPVTVQEALTTIECEKCKEAMNDEISKLMTWKPGVWFQDQQGNEL
jgi:hypothetical protein